VSIEKVGANDFRLKKSHIRQKEKELFECIDLLSIERVHAKSDRDSSWLAA